MFSVENFIEPLLEQLNLIQNWNNYIEIIGLLEMFWLHDNSNSDNSDSYENFQGAISQNTFWNWKKNMSTWRNY